MRLFHLADLHIGISVHGFSMLEDQEYILEQILELADKHSPDAVIIAGDVYDRSVPPAGAVSVLDNFLSGLAERGIKVFIIAGNHDDAKRLAFASRIMENSGVYIKTAYDGDTAPVTLHDDFGEVNFYMLPFIKPAYLRRYTDNAPEDYNAAVLECVKQMGIDTARRNVIIAHQFVTGAHTSESEELRIGGLDNVSAEAFFDFDYAALGHIHRPQHIKRESVRYAGTPLKYSFSEADDKKSVTMAELKEKGNLAITELPLVPKRDMLCVRGKYDTLVSRGFYKDIDTDAYISAVLTDENEIPYAAQKLRVIYPNLMRLRYDNTRTRSHGVSAAAETTADKLSVEQCFEELYRLQNGCSPDEEQMRYIQTLLEQCL